MALTGTGMLQSVGYNTLPIQVKNLHVNDLTEPNAEKIVSKQLSQLSSTNSLLFSCRATFLRKNDMKHALIILLTKVMVIVDLESDSVIDIIMLEKLHSSKGVNADNLFVFKILNEVESPSHEVNNFMAIKIKYNRIKFLAEISSLE